MRRIEKVIIGIALFVFLTITLAGFAFAQRPLEVDYPEVGGIRPQDTTFSLPEYAKYLFNFSLALAGLIAFFVLIYAGYRYMTSAGNPSSQKDAKDRISAAFLGLIILASSYLILTTINPELIFLQVPERVVFQQELLLESEIEVKPLPFTEIPIGGLIEELFSQERLERIQDVSQEVEDKAEEVKILSEELKRLTENCVCSVATSGSCESGSCGGDNDCISDCQCSGDIDPCGDSREAINQRQEEINTALSESEDEKGLKYWQQELDKEVNGYSGNEEEDEEEIIGFKKLYGDLQSAETLIKNCPFSSGPNGKPQILLSYNDFNPYREDLKERGKIEGSEASRPFDYIPTDNTYRFANFYCTETIYSIDAQEEIDEEYLIEIEAELPESVTQSEIYCGKEILIGQTIDNAEELAGRMLTDIDEINKNAIKEIKDAENLIVLPDDCQSSNCSAGMSTSRDCCATECTKCCPPPDEEEEEGGGGEDLPPLLPWWQFWRLEPSLVYAAEDDCENGCCGRSCVDYYCSDCGCLCSGSPCPSGQINNTFSKIGRSYNEIAERNEDFNRLVEEEVEDRLKISKILASLSASQDQIGACFNPQDSQTRITSGETVFWEELTACSEIKDLTEQHIIFYNNLNQEIKECYGSSQGTPANLDNYFCCVSEIFLE